MNSANGKMKAVVLISGGLDSTLAARLIKEQGLEIIALNFKTPFCLCDRKSSLGCRNEAKKVTKDLNVGLKMVNITEDFLKILLNPRHGFGANMNPCIDCRILMFRKAKEFMQQSGADFIVTGEVLGQRPMSQHLRALKIIEKESGLEELVIRPLSAQLLSPTLPEKKGWLKRDKLLNLSGRSRQPQIGLAQSFQIRDYPCAAGGCLLTDPAFAKRVKDLLKYGKLNLNEVELLKVGRHFRISPLAKIVVGRNEQENRRLLNLAKDSDYLFFPPEEVPGPVSLGRGVFNQELIRLSCRISCRYADLNGRMELGIVYQQLPQKETKTLPVSPIDEERLKILRI